MLRVSIKRASIAAWSLCVVAACGSPEAADQVERQQAALEGPYCIDNLAELSDYATAYQAAVQLAEIGCVDPQAAACEPRLDDMAAAQGELEAAQARFFAACPGACTPGQTRCEGNATSRCDANGQWGSPTQCPAGGVCSNGACVQCTSGASSCDSATTVRRCTNGSWQLQQCSNQTCVNGACAGVCSPGQTQCNGSALSRCDANGLWGSPTQCPAGGVCSNGACAQCASGASSCDSATTVRRCVNGSWQLQQCSNQTCVNGACAGVCSPGQRTCINWFTAGVCSSTGTWVNDRFCFGGCRNGGC